MWCCYNAWDCGKVRVSLHIPTSKTWDLLKRMIDPQRHSAQGSILSWSELMYDISIAFQLVGAMSTAALVGHMRCSSGTTGVAHVQCNPHAINNYYINHTSIPITAHTEQISHDNN